jgi:hypothetical protein
MRVAGTTLGHEPRILKKLTLKDLNLRKGGKYEKVISTNASGLRSGVHIYGGYTRYGRPQGRGRSKMRRLPYYAQLSGQCHCYRWSYRLPYTPERWRGIKG